MWDGPLSPWERRLRRRAELFFEKDAEPEDRFSPMNSWNIIAVSPRIGL
jgi:hypothetical protein